jgi:ferredoxin
MKLIAACATCRGEVSQPIAEAIASVIHSALKAAKKDNVDVVIQCERCVAARQTKPEVAK